MAHEQATHSMCQGNTEASGSRAGLALGPGGNWSPCLREAGASATRSSWDTATSMVLFPSIMSRATKLLRSCWQQHLRVTPGTSALRCEVCSPRHLATSWLWQAAAKSGKPGCPSRRASPRQAGAAGGPWLQTLPLCTAEFARCTAIWKRKMRSLIFIYLFSQQAKAAAKNLPSL